METKQIKLIMIIIILFSCNEDKIYVFSEDCIDKLLIDKNPDCTMDVEYVCGCNGYFYINSYWAIADGVTDYWEATPETNCKN